MLSHLTREDQNPLRDPSGCGGKLAAARFDVAVLFQNAFESAFTAWMARCRSGWDIPQT